MKGRIALVCLVVWLLVEPVVRAQDARESFSLGQYAQCVEILERTPPDQRSPEALNMLGASHARLGQRERAEGDFRSAISRYPNHLAAYYNLSELLLQRRAFDEAVRTLNAGLEAFPQSERLLRALGAAYQGAGRYTDAQLVFKRWSSLHPVDYEPYAMLGNSYLESGEYTLALQALEQAAQRTQSNARVAYLTGLAYSYSGRAAEARASFRAAVQLDPALCLAHYELAKSELDSGSEDAAIGLLIKASACNPALPQPHYQLSRIYARRGQDQLAEREMALFLRYRTPNHPGLAP